MSITEISWNESGEFTPGTDLNELRAVGMWDGIETTTIEPTIHAKSYGYPYDVESDPANSFGARACIHGGHHLAEVDGRPACCCGWAPDMDHPDIRGQRARAEVMVAFHCQGDAA